MVKITEKTKNRLRFEIPEEGHTFLNILSTKLLDCKGVEIVTYDEGTHITPDSVMEINTKGKTDPVKSLIDALDSLIKECEDMGKELKKGFSSDMESEKAG